MHGSTSITKLTFPSCRFCGVRESVTYVPTPAYNCTAHPRLALLTIMNAKENKFLTTCATVCSSFVVINAGTHGRCLSSPLGQTQHPSVRLGNLLASRTHVHSWCFFREGFCGNFAWFAFGYESCRVKVCQQF